MVGTLISLIIAGAILFYQINYNIYLGIAFLIVATIVIHTQMLIRVFAWTPLQKLEQNLTPHVTELYKKDKLLYLSQIILIIFLLGSFAINFINSEYILAGWVISLGIAIDILVFSLSRTMSYLDPFYVIDRFGEEGILSIRNTKELELCKWIDTLSESAIKGIQKSSISLTNHSLIKITDLAKTYLESEKSIAHHEEDEPKEIGTPDAISFTLFYLFQRLEMIYNIALEKKLEPICSDIITLLGKTIFYAAKCDITLAGYPVHFLGKFALEAQKKGIPDASNKAILALVEVSKIMVNEIDTQYLELKEIFFSIISYMNEISKEIFRQDKNINIRLLIEPFRNLREIFSGEKIVTHQDTPLIQNEITKVIDEFTTLENVMMTMPPLKDITPLGTQ